MNCRDAAERITALVDGELPPAEREELDRHLAGCPACRAARAAEEAVAARLRAAPRPALPEGFAGAVMAKVGAARPRGRVIPLWPLVAAATAVAAAVVAMVAVGPGVPRAGSFLTASAPQAARKAIPLPSPSAPVGGDPEREKGFTADTGRVEPEGAGAGAAGAGVAAAEEAGEGAPPAARPPAPVPAPVAPPEVDTAKADAEGKETKKSAKSEVPAEDRKAPDDEDRRRRSAAATAAPAATRISVLYRVPVVADTQRALDGLLMANRGLASRGGPWAAADENRAADKDSTIDRAASGRMEVPAAGRVLLLRVRPENLDRLRAALDKAAGVKDSGLELLDRGGALPPEVARLFPAGEEPRAAGVLGGAPAPSPPAPAKAKARGDAGPSPAPAPAPAPASGPPNESRAGDDNEPGPPPKPSAEQLRKLADAPPASKEGPTVETGTPSAEILVEVRLEVRPPEGGK